MVGRGEEGFREGCGCWRGEGGETESVEKKIGLLFLLIDALCRGGGERGGKKNRVGGKKIGVFF